MGKQAKQDPPPATETQDRAKEAMEASGTGGADVKENPSDATAAVATEATTEAATGAQKEAALADAALACVHWDESVDVGRLLLLEHEHDVGLLRAIVARAGVRLDQYDEDRSFDFINDARAMSLWGLCGADSVHDECMYVRRHDGTLWSVERDQQRMSDAQTSSWLAVCARHCLFSIEYDIPVKEAAAGGVRASHIVRDSHEEKHHGHMWLASVARGLAGRSGAWTGTEIMRTRNLCLALLAVLGARAKGGPLAAIDLPGNVRVDQSALPAPTQRRESDDSLLASLADGLAQAEHIRDAGFAVFLGPTGRRRADLDAHSLCGHTRQVLSMVYAAVGRLYATESVYMHVIAPAEYDALVANAPLGATFFH